MSSLDENTTLAPDVWLWSSCAFGERVTTATGIKRGLTAEFLSMPITISANGSTVPMRITTIVNGNEWQAVDERTWQATHILAPDLTDTGEQP